MIEPVTACFEMTKDELLCMSELERTRLEIERNRLRERAAELERQVGRLKRIYDMAPVGFLTLDASGRITDLNKAAADLIAPGRKLRLPAQFCIFLAERSLASFFDHIRRCRLMEKQAVQTEIELTLAGKQTAPALLISALSAGPARQFETALIDTRAHRAAQQALTIACRYAEEVVHSMPYPVLNLDNNGHVTTANAAFCRSFQTDVRRVVNLPFDELEGIQWEMPELAEEMRRALRRNEELNVELLRATLASGSVLTLSVAARPVPGPDQLPTGLLVAFEDITRRHRLDEERDRLFKELQEERATLELRVRERTEELAESNRQLREMSERLLAAQESEQRRIARELHDEIGQGLTALRILMSRGAKEGEDPSEILAQSLGATDEIVRNVRALCGSLRPSALDDLGLLPALRGHIQTFGERTGIAVRFSTRGIDESRIQPAIRSTIFRVVQEGLTNVARHSGAKSAAVQLRQGAAIVSVEIADRGRGFAAEAVSVDCNGLSGIRERVTLAKGSCAIESAPGEGTRISIQLPVDRAPAQRKAMRYDQDHSSRGPQPRAAGAEVPVEKRNGHQPRGRSERRNGGAGAYRKA